MESVSVTSDKTIASFPKIFPLGKKYILDIFQGVVEVTEKIDGSQFVFQKTDDELLMRSKGKMLYDNADKMFKIAIDYVKQIENRIPPKITFYAEYLMRPRHNVLKYNRIPVNNLILFGAQQGDSTFIGRTGLETFAATMGIETVPILFNGTVKNAEDLFYLLDKESVLGGTKIEGFVVKNYTQGTTITPNYILPIMSGKFVSEKFKEKHEQQNIKNKNRWELYKARFRAEARWNKAIQHLAESGKLVNDYKDIGPLIQEVMRDIRDEHEDEIKEFLLAKFLPEVLREAIAGLPEFYKKRLATAAIHTGTEKSMG